MRKNPNQNRGYNNWNSRSRNSSNNYEQNLPESYTNLNHGEDRGFRQPQPTTSGGGGHQRSRYNSQSQYHSQVKRFKPNHWRPPNRNPRNRYTSESNTDQYRPNRQQYNRRQHSLEARNRNVSNTNETQVQCRSEESSDIPGFSFDPVTGKYFKILPNAPGQPRGSTRSDLASIKKAHQVEQMLKQTPENKMAPIRPLAKMLQDVSLGLGGKSLNGPAKKMVNDISKYRISKTNVSPSYSVEVLPNFGENIVGCEFLEVADDGKTIVGCWPVDSQLHSATNRGTSRMSAHIVCLDVKADHELALRECDKFDSGKDLIDSNGRYNCNTYGLKFAPKEHDFYIYDPVLVDMMIAPIDTEVTCMLYVSARSVFNANHQPVNTCSINLKPIIDLTKEDGMSIVDSPIYNIHYNLREPVWSCAWNEPKTSIGVGLEDGSLVIDPISDSRFKVSSGRKHVLSQRFSTDGNLLYLGRRNANMSLLDLRMSHHHTIGGFDDSSSTAWIHQMKHRSNYILSENMSGKIKLWDTRSLKCVEEFHGHRNSFHKLPYFIDPSERFLFAVDNNGITRGWSLTTTELLCTIPCPRPVEGRADFPRVIFSENWGGVGGNAAIILAVDNELRIHELLL